jgi:hypothetical protein
MMALTDKREVFAWGYRMGIYPGIELTYHSLKKNAKLFNFSEINQPKPR